MKGRRREEGRRKEGDRGRERKMKGEDGKWGGERGENRGGER